MAVAVFYGGVVELGQAELQLTKEQARALTFYMLALTNGQMGSYCASVRMIPGPSQGRQILVEKSCRRATLAEWGR
jgi:hypothetical protein